MLYSELDDKQVAPPTLPYSGAKHIPLSSQRPFHSNYSIDALFHFDQKKLLL